MPFSLFLKRNLGLQGLLIRKRKFGVRERVFSFESRILH